MNDTQQSYRIAVQTTLIAGVFSAIVAGVLLVDLARRRAADPFEDPRWLSLRAALREDPENEALAEQLRLVDVSLREEFFRQRRFTEVGAYLLLGGAVVMFAAWKAAATLRRRLPQPEPIEGAVDRETPEYAQARWAVVAVAVVLVVAAALLLVRSQDLRGRLEEALAVEDPAPAEPAPAEAPAAAPAAAADLPGPSAEEWAAAWPRFRGPLGSGISPYTNIPTVWDGAGGENVLWKTPVPLEGNSSPIVWGDRIFLTGADEERREVYSFDAGSGELLWQREVPGTPQSTAQPPQVMEMTGYAASTPATDGRRVYAIFANGDVAAVDFDGEVVWSRSLGIPVNVYGHASSLLIHGETLFVQFDQGSSGDSDSRLLALAVASGETQWEVEREVPNSWTTPIVFNDGDREQLITAAAPYVIAYDPADGTELWRVDCLRQDVGPSPVYGDGIVFVANEFPGVTAIRPDGTGDVTETHVLWTGDESPPDTSSPLATGEPAHLLITLASYGILCAYDALEGEPFGTLPLWEGDFMAHFVATPSLVDDRLYLFCDEGKGWVLRIDREGHEIVAENDLGEGVFATPAFQEGRMFVRGTEHLFAIGQ